MKSKLQTTKVLCIALIGFALAIQGCATTRGQRVAKDDSQNRIGCQRCFDLALAFQRDAGKSLYRSRSQFRNRHMCDGCQAHIELYTLDGKPMIRCPQCAPSGQACDECRPPKPPTKDEQDTNGK